MTRAPRDAADNSRHAATRRLDLVGSVTSRSLDPTSVSGCVARSKLLIRSGVVIAVSMVRVPKRDFTYARSQCSCCGGTCTACCSLLVKVCQPATGKSTLTCQNPTSPPKPPCTSSTCPLASLDMVATWSSKSAHLVQRLGLIGRYLQAQGLMHVPTYVLFIVSPLNLVFNYLLVCQLALELRFASPWRLADSRSGDLMRFGSALSVAPWQRPCLTL